MTGTTQADFKRYRQLVTAFYLEKTNAEQKASVGPALYRNMLAYGGELSLLVETLDVKTLAKETGYEEFLKFLELKRFTDSQLKELPRVYDKFYGPIWSLYFRSL